MFQTATNLQTPFQILATLHQIFDVIYVWEINVECVEELCFPLW